MTMTNEEAKRYVLSQEPTFLPRAKNGGGKHSYCCPFGSCKNGTGKNGTGIVLIPNSENHPKYHCFVCGESGDVFDLAKEYFGLTKQSDVFDAVYKYYGVDVYNPKYKNANKKMTSRVEEAIRTAQNMAKTHGSIHADVKYEERQDYQDQLPYFNKVRKSLDPTYLESRGISEETQKHYWIGTDKHWKNPITVKKYLDMGWPVDTIKSTPRCIIPTDTHSYLARDIRGESLDEKEKRFAKMKYGNTPIFNKKLSCREDIIFVTEGEIDAISIYEAVKKEASALGSTSNWRHLVAQAQEGGDYSGKAFVLLLDNDAPGKKAQELLKDALESLGSIVLTPSLGEYKDPNKYLTSDRVGFTNMLNEALTEVKNIIATRDYGCER